MFDQGCDFIGHWQILVGHCPMTDSYLQPCKKSAYYLIHFYVLGLHVFCLAWLSPLIDSFYHDLEAVYELSPC